MNRNAFFDARGSKERFLRLLGIMVLLVTALSACGQQPAKESAVDTPGAAASTGLFESLECGRCHKMDGSGPGPSLTGLYGQNIHLENGETITVDEKYIRTAILDPQAQTHAGYPPIMPSYKDRIGEEELLTLIAYIRSLEGEK